MQTPSEVGRTHIAIDRFAGEVLSAAPYTTETPESGSFAANLRRDHRDRRQGHLRLRIDLGRFRRGRGGRTPGRRGSPRADQMLEEQ